MRIIFTNHARARMQERGISEKEVTECILRPDKLVQDSVHICRFQKLVSYGILEVVGKYKGAYLIVITTYPL